MAKTKAKVKEALESAYETDTGNKMPSIHNAKTLASRKAAFDAVVADIKDTTSYVTTHNVTTDSTSTTGINQLPAAWQGAFTNGNSGNKIMLNNLTTPLWIDGSVSYTFSTTAKADAAYELWQTKANSLVAQEAGRVADKTALDADYATRKTAFES